MFLIGSKDSLEVLNASLLYSVGLGPADQVPVVFDLRQASLVDGVAEELAKFDKHRWRAWLSFESLLFDVEEDLGSQLFDQFQELWTHLAILNKRHILQLLLIVNWPNEHEAISFLKEVGQFFPNAILPHYHIA